MLMGKFEHSLDPKNRINFPARFREQLGESFILTVGLDECIAVYSEEEWAKLEARIAGLPMAKARSIKRYFFSNAVTVEPDKQGRILLPAHLREYAHLDKDVLVTGVSDHAEIWDPVHWESCMSEMSSDSVAEAMDELDF